MTRTVYAFVYLILSVSAFVGGLGTPARALEQVTFHVSGVDEALKSDLKAASLVQSVKSQEVTAPREVFAAALADYGRLTETLYANGYYSGVVQIRVDGREAGAIPPFSEPNTINTIAISITPGPTFRFGTTKVDPVAPGGTLPDGFRSGEIARSELVQQAADGSVADWRDAGHAKVAVTGQKITANHANQTLSAFLYLTPGPKVRFGALRQTTNSAVRASRIQRIAGLPKGAQFSPDTLDTVAKRLRRTGAFSSVSLSEATTLGSDDTLDIDLALVDAKPRRFGAGAELSSLDGLTLSGFWMHRNFLGGAERFRVDGEVAGIGGQHGGIDYRLGVRLDQPATFGPDTGGFLYGGLEYEDEPGYISRRADLGGGVTRIFSKTLEGELGFGLRYSETMDYLGERRFFLATLPGVLTWDRRDNALNPTSGFYLRGKVTPFISLDTGGAGAWGLADGRIYRGFGGGKYVLAARAQIGTVLAGNTGDIPPDYLFYSGGGNSVRGHPYQSLGVDAGGGRITGGQGYVALSAELRAAITDTIGVVGFVDAGHVGDTGLLAGAGDWQVGAGLGLRYQTPIGPLRFDVAGPVSGDTGAGVQIYLGIGQAF